MKFFDRKEHLAALWEIRERSYSNHSVMTVVSGSVYSLMEKLFKDREEPLYGREDRFPVEQGETPP